jgi:gliding motility-associated-like protein
VTVSAYPVVSFTSDTTSGFPVLQVTFENTSTPFSQSNFVWDFGGYVLEDNAQFVTFPFEDPGTYNVVLTGSLNGCESSSSGQIVVFPFDPPIITSPNVFSPNNDNANDLWQFITFTNVREIEFVIINRWGNVVFESSDLNLSWDGKNKGGDDVSEGVYFYKYVVLGFDEKTYEGHGSITVVREK